MRMLAVDVEHGEHRLEPVGRKAVYPRLHVLRILAFLPNGVPAKVVDGYVERLGYGKRVRQGGGTVLEFRIQKQTNYTIQSQENMLL